MNAMSLFLKIFLWFWLAIALLIGVFSFVSWTTQNEPLVRQRRILFAESFNFQVQTAGQIYQNEGKAGLDEYLARIENSDRVSAIGFYDKNRRLISGDEIPSNGLKLFDQAMNSEVVEFDRSPDETFAAKHANEREITRRKAFVRVIPCARRIPWRALSAGKLPSSDH